MTHEDLHQGPIVAELDEARINELRILANGVDIINGSFRRGKASLDLGEARELRDRLAEDIYLSQMRARLAAFGMSEGVDVIA